MGGGGWLVACAPAIYVRRRRICSARTNLATSFMVLRHLRLATAYLQRAPPANQWQHAARRRARASGARAWLFARGFPRARLFAFSTLAPAKRPLFGARGKARFSPPPVRPRSPPPPPPPHPLSKRHLFAGGGGWEEVTGVGWSRQVRLRRGAAELLLHPQHPGPHAQTLSDKRRIEGEAVPVPPPPPPQDNEVK